MVLKNKGFSLVGVMVAASVGLLLLMAFVNSMNVNLRMVHRLESKMESMKIEKDLITMFNDTAVCSSSLQNLTVNTADNSLTNLTSILALTPNNPLQALIDSYATNRLVSIDTVQLFKPALKLAGGQNNGPSFDYKVRLTVREKTHNNTGSVMRVEGPTIILGVSGTTVNPAPNSCLDGGPVIPNNIIYECPTLATVSGSVNSSGGGQGGATFYYPCHNTCLGQLQTKPNCSRSPSASGMNCAPPVPVACSVVL